MNGLKTPFRSKTTHMLAAAITVVLFSAQGQAETQVRLQSSSNGAAFSEGYSLSVEDWSEQTQRSNSTRFNARDFSQFSHQHQNKPQVWISDIGTLLFDDHDGDGYHSGFSMTIDVDSEYGDTEVYANIYLQSDTQTLSLLHKTSRFSVYGSTLGDEYRIDTELRNNFATDDYDVVVDIHDAWSDQLLDTANARGFSNLSHLPLESSDQNEDYLSDDDHDSQDLNGEADVVVTEYAGAFHPLWLLALISGWAARRKIRQLS